MQDLISYKKMPQWNPQTLPTAFQERHNTQEGTWAKLTILQGKMTFALLHENGDIQETFHCSQQHQPPFVEPQVWHRIVSFSDDLECQLSFFCTPEDFYHKKYGLTRTHSDVIDAMPFIKPGKTLDLGCGGGRNALYLNLRGFNVTAYDKNEHSIGALNDIIRKEDLKNIQARTYDINLAAIKERYDFILSTVVLMFLAPERMPHIIRNIQESTLPGGHNLIIAAMSTDDYPCPMPFSFTFKEGELKNYYADWEIVKYNEELGELHKTDENGNRIKLRFATLLARKIS
ncbi:MULTISPECIES: SAM-dependent methyltransferase TehB [unclassified Brenneria]|uniref:SAM-dependent methyltransferase TehB n=1 Tax=unclassified Brenneria TaxID=2634434 RepID=UPI001557DFBF|nr:SAM-dependent methyltransferase TehB [Brenneria sp. hezel4-2-4]MEE3650550.1 SAM-dependent methyltransferase TehB [Brenneria sp. HEZEL_4_2_4]NPD00505.1 SAM-dependent methyltransferase TehB [Brenneria sp. hezel4-2-4]